MSSNNNCHYYSEMMWVKKQLERIAYSLSYQSLQFMPEFELRVGVLKRLRYLGNEDQLKLKGLLHNMRTPLIFPHLLVVTVN